MKVMKKIPELFLGLKKRQRIELSMAATITLFLVIAVPAYAWFSYSKQMETVTKIKAPATLDIRAGNKDAIENFELKNIDIKDIKDSDPKCYVFCVKTGNINTHYDIQLAHTTNIPFTYSLYRATEVAEGTEGIVVDYSPLADPDQHTYYKKGEAVTLVQLNPDEANAAYYGRTLAKRDDTYYAMTYGEEEEDGLPEIYAVPIYSRANNLATLDADYDFFILELGWDGTTTGTGFDKWNQAENNKETDMIYISASKHTQ